MMRINLPNAGLVGIPLNDIASIVGDDDGGGGDHRGAMPSEAQAC